MREVRSIESLTAEIVEWANQALPGRVVQSALLKLFEETGELVRDPKKSEEYADICIMLFDLAHMNGVDLTQAIVDKMAINRGRVWTVTPSGTFQHFTAPEPKGAAPMTGYEFSVVDPTGFPYATTIGLDREKALDEAKTYAAQIDREGEGKGTIIEITRTILPRWQLGGH